MSILAPKEGARFFGILDDLPDVTQRHKVITGQLVFKGAVSVSALVGTPISDSVDEVTRLFPNPVL